MNLFLKKTVLFAIVFISLLNAGFYIIDFYYNNNFEKDSIFIWGDSQTYHGIDLDVLHQKTGKTIYSAGKPGAGVYTFLVFAHQVPENSTVIVSISKLAQIRRKIAERNNSKISFQALKTMYQNGYSLSALTSIVIKNKLPNHVFANNSKMMKVSDSLAIDMPLSSFESYYKIVPAFLNDRQKSYLAGIKILKEKHCKIVFIEFPYHSILQKVEMKSPVKPRTEQFKNSVVALFPDCTIDTLHLSNTQNKMYDFTHLNELGAKETTELLSKEVIQNHPTQLLIVKLN